MTIELTDDGTMDTVLRCSECGEEFRCNYDPTSEGPREYEERLELYIAKYPHLTPKQAADRLAEKDYGAFVAEMIEEITSEHECNSSEED